MANADAGDVTRLLSDAAGGNRVSSAELFEQVYSVLRGIARQRMGEERREHTLQATALVHEAWLRLIGDAPVEWRSRGQFFVAAAEAMRRILIDHARKRGAVKRGAGLRAVSGVLDLASDENSGDAMILDDLILRLEKEDGRAAQVVRLRFFSGLSIEETASVLGISEPTVKRDWNYARAWLVEAWRNEPE